MYSREMSSAARFTFAFAVVACSSESEPPCEPSLRVACSECPQGTVQFAMDYRRFDVRPEGGIVTTGCDGIIRFDASFREQSRLALAPGFMFYEFALGGDELYVTEADTSQLIGPGGHPRWYLASYGTDGTARWRKPLGITLYPSWSFERDNASGYGVGLLDRDGQPRSLPGALPDTYRSFAKHDGVGNIVVGYNGQEKTPIATSSVVRLYEPTDGVRWTNTWTARNSGSLIPSLWLEDAARAPTGDVAVLGIYGGGALDLGSHQLAWSGGGTWFVVLLTPAGDITWTMQLDTTGVDYEAIAFSGSEVVVSGAYSETGSGLGLPPGDYRDLFLAVIADAQVRRVVPMRGLQAQYLGSLRSDPGGDGVIVSVSTSYEKTELQIGSQVFDEPRLLFKLRP